MAPRFLKLRIASAYCEYEGRASARTASAVSVGTRQNSKIEICGPFDMNLPPDIHRAELGALVMALRLAANQMSDESENDPYFIITILTRSEDLVTTMTEDRAILEGHNIGNIDLVKDAVDLEELVTGRRLGPVKARVQYVCVPRKEVMDVQRKAQQVADGKFPVSP